MNSPNGAFGWTFRALALTSALLTVALVAVIFFGAANLTWTSRLFENDHGWLSCIFLSLAIITFLKGYRRPEWDGFSPLRLYYSLWFGLLALGCLRLTTMEPPFTVRFWVTVVCGLVGFFVGAHLARGRHSSQFDIPLGKIKEHLKLGYQPFRALCLIGGFFTIALAAFAYTCWRAGMVPLLADDPNWARFNFAVNSYVQRFAMSFYLLVFLSYVGFMYVRVYRIIFLIMGCASFIGITLMTARVPLLSAVWMCMIIFHYGRHRVTPKVALSLILIGYPLAKLTVDVKRFYENPTFNRVLDQIDFPEKLRAFSPDYLYFTSTLQTLDNLTRIVPNEIQYSYGWYIAYPIRVFWTPRQGDGFRGRLDDLFWDRSADWSPFPAVTTSYMGWPYADFGIAGVFLFSGFFGWLATRVYTSLRLRPTFWSAFLYSQLSFAILLSLYSSYLSLFDVYWNIAVVGLIHHFAADRPEVTSKAVHENRQWLLDAQA